MCPELSFIGNNRLEIYYHLTHGLNSEIYLEFTEFEINIRTINDTIVTFSSHILESVADNYPTGKFLLLNDKEQLSTIKAVLKRKTATIGIYVECDNLYFSYKYKVKKEEIEHTLCLGKLQDVRELDDLLISILNRTKRIFNESVPYDEDIYPQLLLEKDIEPSKFEFDVISIDGVMLNKNDLLRILRVYGNHTQELYFSYNRELGIAMFESSNHFMLVYNKLVNKIES